jgi:hypothetical protein
MGQLIDLVSSPEHIIDLNRFSLEKSVCVYRTLHIHVLIVSSDIA